MKKITFTLVLFLFSNIFLFGQSEDLPDIPDGLSNYSIRYDSNNTAYLLSSAYDETQSYILYKNIENNWVNLKYFQFKNELNNFFQSTASENYQINLIFDNNNTPILQFTPLHLGNSFNTNHFFAFYKNKWQYVLTYDTPYDTGINGSVEYSFNDNNQYVRNDYDSGELFNTINYGTIDEMLINREPYDTSYLSFIKLDDTNVIDFDNDNIVNPTPSEFLNDYFTITNASEADYDEFSIINENVNTENSSPIYSVELNNFTNGKTYVLLTYINSEFKYLNKVNSDDIDLNNFFFEEMLLPDNNNVSFKFAHDETGVSQEVAMGNLGTMSNTEEPISERDLLEFSIDNSFEYEVIEDVVRYDIWEQFQEDNKTTNLKPEIVTGDTTQSSHLLYDNLNNVFSTDISADSGNSTISSLKKYDIINDSWLDIGSSSLQELFEFDEENFDQPNNIRFPSSIRKIYTNTVGEHYILTGYSGLSTSDFSRPIHILKYNEQTNEWNVIYSDSLLGDTPTESIYFIGDYFYLLTYNSLVFTSTIEGKNGEMIEDAFVEVKKSVDTKTITLGFKNLNKINKSPNIYFTNGTIYCDANFTITSVLNSKGQSIENKNLLNNTIYIVTIRNKSGATYSLKILNI